MEGRYASVAVPQCPKEQDYEHSGKWLAQTWVLHGVLLPVSVFVRASWVTVLLNTGANSIYTVLGCLYMLLQVRQWISKQN